MKITRLNTAIVLGLVAIVGILLVQIFWIRQAFNNEGKKFSQTVHITLLHVIDRLYELNNNEFPLQNPINKVSNDYYIVNVNNDFDAQVLEYCLKTELERSNLLTDFEYAIYKCESDEMVYGNYVSFHDAAVKQSAFPFPKQKNLVYYFAIRFPGEASYLLASLKFWIILSAILVLVLLIYVYSIFTILQQKKYSELQHDFINNMTHEFKTPLSSILIASTYLSKQESIKSDEKLGKYTSMIIDQSNKLNTHIETVLNVAKYDNGPLVLQKKPLVLLPLVKQVSENMQIKYESLQVKLEFENEHLSVYADEFHFTNILYNLLDNSAKYSDAEPEVTIRLFEQRNNLRLELSDKGIGIPEKKIPLIFDKFYRISSRHSNDVNGFGLGLYYVKKISLLHNWEVGVVNNAEKGITVYFNMPKSK